MRARAQKISLLRSYRDYIKVEEVVGGDGVGLFTPLDRNFGGVAVHLLGYGYGDIMALRSFGPARELGLL